ncbi:MAG: alpha/beta hydrolase family protein [Fimbriimonas sp.]
MKWAVLLGTALLGAGCGSENRPAAPKFPPARVAKEDDLFREQIVDPVTGRRVWLFPSPYNDKPKGLIVIASAGSNLISGAAMEEDRALEHHLYVSAGYVVVAYDVSGPMPENADDAQNESAIRAFTSREAGILDGVAAIDAGLKAFPSTASNVIAVGHSSAGTLALGLAAYDARVAKCIAYAPVTNILAFIGPENSRALADYPDVHAALQRNSPHALIPKLKKPTFLFVAKDDRVVSPASVTEFAARLKANGTPVKLVTVESGGHQRAMLVEGRSLAVDWLDTLPSP